MTSVLRVVTPGLLTTVQDLGRPHAIASGVPAGGAMDRFALAAANLIAGNDAGGAALECTLSGPHLVAEGACLIAIAGADLGPHVNGQEAPMWTAIVLGVGDALTFGRRRAGARAYIAVAGGVAGDRWLGSLSTNLMAARGGFQGRPLNAGDELSTAAEPSTSPVSGRHLAEPLRPDYADHALHAIPGPHSRRLDEAGRHALFSQGFTVSRESDRMGYRLDGPLLDASGDELLSFGLAAGVIQVPRSGQPILLMADHQTAGGYPVVATVISADLPIAAQMLPGDELRFMEITMEAAQSKRNALNRALDSLRTVAGS